MMDEYYNSLGIEFFEDGITLTSHKENALKHGTAHAVDKLYEIQEEIKHLNEQLDILKSDKKSIEKQVLYQMSMMDCNVLGGNQGKVVLKSKEVVTIPPDKWDEFHEFVRRTDSFHLLQKRVAQQPMLELMHDGEDIPGVKVTELKKLSISKL